MLGTDAGEQAVLGMHQIAKLLDIAHMTRTHFSDKNLMLAFELLVDNARKAHRRIEAGGRGQHAVFLREYIAQDKFGGGLAVAADVYKRQPWARCCNPTASSWASCPAA